jgi:hypothetical protein
MNQSRKSSKATTITTAMASPSNPAELNETLLQLVNATRGTYGDGEWDGGIAGNGYWCKYAAFWDAKLSADISGTTTIKFPFVVTDSAVRVYHLSGTPSMEVFYINSADALNLTGHGKTIIEVSLVQIPKEAQ